MAVKVIDPTPDPKVVKRVSCENCGARLEYVPLDVQHRVVTCSNEGLFALTEKIIKGEHE